MNRTCPVHGKETPCHVCKHINDSARGKGRQLRLRDAQGHRPPGYIVTGYKIDEKNLADWMRRLADDPVRSAELAANSRRPAGVSRERFGMAIKINAGEPVLTASPKSVRDGIGGKLDYAKNPKLALFECVATIVVKPNCSQAAKAGRNSAFWGERMWKVYNLKYAKGFCAVTDLTDYTPKFNTMGELMSAIRSSGWDIVR